MNDKYEKKKTQLSTTTLVNFQPLLDKVLSL